MDNNNEPKAAEPLTPDQRMRKMSRRSFAWGGLAVLGAYGVFHWLDNSADSDDLKSPFRRILGFNESVFGGIYSSSHHTPEYPNYPKDQLGSRLNESIGVPDEFTPADWRLHVFGVASKPELVLTFDQIKAMPRRVMTTEFKCIEGWSQIVQWTGCPIPDFLKAYPVEGSPKYVSIQTPSYPDVDPYFVGLDFDSFNHPQAMLCYEMNGEPLTPEHGAPVRLVIPHKYGIKNIKHIGEIRFTNERPKDYWALQGYDWYAGL